MTWALAAVCLLATVPAGLRWLRIAQREHYHATSVTRFAWRWSTTSPSNMALAAAGLIGVAASLWNTWFGILTALAQVGPVGLSVKGRTSPLAWTPRLRRLAFVSGAVVILVYLTGAFAGLPAVVVAGLAGMPLVIDVVLTLLAPVEHRMGTRWVEKARHKLEMVGADVVAITGSYGKTTTKNYVAHLVGGSLRTVASPASFNNRMGLARAINENLTPGTEVFVAEMGTYGPGEISELCDWIPPRVAAMVSVGPVHLERFRTLERIVDAKAEILDRAKVGVICVNNRLLADLARERAARMKIIEVADEGGVIFIEGAPVAEVPEGVFGENLAVALGICRALGLDLDELASRLEGVPIAEHRQSVTRSEAGFAIIDDTFNANPAGARRGLQLLARSGEGRLAVVTPGMVELGALQHRENVHLAATAAEVADDIVIVGRTNRDALLEGSARGKASVTVVDSREQAVAWVRENLGPGDAVLYENDLPDHYP